MIWKTIESAPKDGRNILLLSEKGCSVARWRSDEEEVGNFWVGVCENEEIVTWKREYYVVDNPSHWMFLPTPQKFELIKRSEYDDLQ